MAILKTTVYLRDEMYYLINPKKVYRLMKENNLLYVIAGVAQTVANASG